MEIFKDMLLLWIFWFRQCCKRSYSVVERIYLIIQNWVHYAIRTPCCNLLVQLKLPKLQCSVTNLKNLWNYNINIIFITSYKTSLPKFDWISSPTLSIHISRRLCITSYNQTAFSAQLHNSQVIDLAPDLHIIKISTT